MTIMKFCTVFEALGSEIRLQVFDFIMQAGEEGVAPKEIVQQFGVDSGTLQFHLKKLMNVNLVSKKNTRRNRRYYCSSNIPAVFQQLVLQSDAT
ncbi:winged helix-turn-helix domain-containing protein [Polynucleobacter sp. AP-Sving-400A-A2]|uniref:winged helix-turn-helix domain-containing protein n=1 Tax=Polynucleobacter sp. AP-Sving-400A-A2 TaxID=2081049 RepID=UPI001BFD46A6|nr:winged helix-turn-helix domain-containing protein [Polynucleobacter sp. AP-Sving-400A-A2]QWE13866.1 winged helix-turn-helix transcriptional regulator [Polynucleobacter sp. AP-Sving-400A-A2]